MADQGSSRDPSGAARASEYEGYLSLPTCPPEQALVAAGKDIDRLELSDLGLLETQDVESFGDRAGSGYSPFGLTYGQPTNS